MSTSRQKLKTDPEEEMRDVEHQKSQRKNKLSHRKKGKDSSSDSGSDNQSSDDEAASGAGKKRRGGNEDDLDDDEDEEDYDDEDQSNQSSFIARDEDVERELEDELLRKEEESRKKRKKKKKSRHFKSLEDDDFELIKDNTGMDIQKPVQRKRLTKQSEKEKIVDQAEEVKTSHRAPLKAEDDQPMYDQREHSDEDAFRRKGGQSQAHDQDMANEGDGEARRRVPQAREQSFYDQQDPARVQMARQIFDTSQGLAEEIEARKKQQLEDTQQYNDITTLFDGDEIDDQFATKADKIIAERDIPERLQLKLGEHPEPTENELWVEADWISERMFQDQKRKGMIYNTEHVKKKIQKVLRMFRIEHLDIPMITRYRRYEYQKELDEQDVWIIFKLDLEYEKYNQQKGQILKFLKKVAQFDPAMYAYETELTFVKNQNELNDFSALITFLKSYYLEELAMLPEEQKKRVPGRTDLVQNSRKYRLDEFARQCMLKPQQFVENLQNNSNIHQPPDITSKIPISLAKEYISDLYYEEIKVFSGVCKFVSHELSVQPYIRSLLKKTVWKHGTLTTKPTEQGQKDIDIFHPSYKIKRIDNQPLEDFKNDDRFLDILLNEKAKLITLQIEMNQEAQDNFYHFLEQRYITKNETSQWNIMRKEALRKLQQDALYPEIIKEITNELKDYSENYVISKCKDKYRNLLMTGPFQTSDSRNSSQQDDRQSSRKQEEEVIKDRPRLNVMGVVLQQIDNNNSAVTIAVVDKFGELVAHKDLLHLMPPRKPKNLQRGDDQDQGRSIQQQVKTEEQKEHEKDRDKIMDLITKHSVDLIVVGANKLEARKIKEALTDIAAQIKNFDRPNWKNEDDPRRSKGSRQGDNYYDDKKEAIVIWGSLEIPKLFSSSHQSTKLLKQCHPILKQAVSLARFEQDPMCEILNLWSSAPSENQILQCNLHPLQKQLNQAKLADSLEEISVQCVNEVGVDLNLLVDHDYMHATLQFISGLGPRKARKLIQKIKSTGKKVQMRGDIYKEGYLTKYVYISAVAFLKIRCSQDQDPDQFYDPLDQTRIHQESYVLALKVASDVLYDQQERGDKLQQYQAIKEVIKKPQKLKTIDVKKYNQELELTGQANMTIILDLIIEELQNPFKDPREYRTPTRQPISNQQLFYMLIDESERTFKKGIIVTATAIKVLDKKVYCKLDNGLDAIIYGDELLGKNNNERLEKAIQPGHVISGRISDIKIDVENNFSVTLNCKKSALEKHDDFIPQEMNKKFIPEEDLINSNFQIEKKDVKQSRYQSRRINHPKFQNISSTKALQELQDKDVGDFIFRPSSKGSDNITLTWKFYTNNIVHMDIEERDKPTGASIGNILLISDEQFESLQEIIDRYIIPSNRSLRDVINHPKFQQCHSQEDLEASLRKEKQDEPQKIPYKFTILEKYPQHIVLGYIPRTSLVKEYIKVKPRGYFFHENFHNPFQNLINWFKDNFKTKEYLKIVRRQKSPRVKTAIEPSNQRSNRNIPQQDWRDVNKEWRSGGDSVHSMNDNMETPLVMKTEHNQNRQSEYGAQEGQTTGTGIGAFSEYNQNNLMSSSRQQQDNVSRGPPRGRSDICYNCKEVGHMAKDCPTKDRSSRGPRPSRDEGGYGRENGDYHRDESGFAQTRSPAQNWGGNGDNSLKQEANPPKSPSGWGTKAEGTPKVDQGWDQQNSASGGWGSKTPQRNEQQNAWGDGTVQEQWTSSGVNNDNDNDRRNSPTRSQRSYDDNRGDRGRGRGRGGRGGAPGGGGDRTCYKCHQEGHMARECPNAESMPRDSGRGGGRGECYKCHEQGHMARECPNADPNDRGRGRGRGGFGGGGRACYNCNQEGHISRECPNQNDDRNGRPYKRQRREDGGSTRRDNDDYNGGVSSSGANWNTGSGAGQAWDDNLPKSQFEGSAATGQESNAWGQVGASNNGGGVSTEGGWGAVPTNNNTANAQPNVGNGSWNQTAEGEKESNW